MTILLVGDSYAYGSELKDSPLTSWRDPGKISHPPSQFCFGSLYAKAVGQDIENYSLPGGSNDRTFRYVIEKSLEKKYDLIICVWTTLARMDMTYMGVDMPITYANTEYFKDSFPWFKQIYLNHHDPIKEAQSWFAKLITLQSHFNLIKQNYVFMNSCIPASDFKHIPKSKDRFIDRKKFIGYKDKSLMEWCSHLPQGAGGHFLEEGHELVAKKMLEFIKI